MSNKRKGMGMVPKKPAGSADATAAKPPVAPPPPATGMARVRLETPSVSGAGGRPSAPATGISQRTILNTGNPNFERQKAARDAGFDTQMIPLAEIQFDPAQPRQRTRYSEADAKERHADVVELATSIKREGLRHPVEVEELVTEPGKPQAYRLVVGETRLRAYQHLALEDAKFLCIPAHVKRSLTLAERRLHQASENYYRRSLTPVEEAEMLDQMRTDLATIKGGSGQLSWEELGAEMKGLSAVAIDHCRRISLLPTSAKDLLRARHQPARSTIYRALQSVKREDEIAVLKALHDAIHKADEAEVSQASNERTKAARDARQKGIALRRFASVTVTEDEGAPISLDVRVGVEAGRWKALQGDTAARRQHEIETWRRIRDKAERELSTLEGGEGR